MNSRVRTVLIVAITLGLLAFFFRDADFAGVWAETRRADPWLLLAAIVATGLTYAFRAWRWQSLLAPIGETRFSTAFRTTIIGFSASFFLPARAGEVIRPYLLARREGLPPPAAFAASRLHRSPAPSTARAPVPVLPPQSAGDPHESHRHSRSDR